ncbi:hypothetical protein KAI87_07765, partial [Myxococcota bacterium]|nr:hypothetical protein [Myxococcota bacterium]
MAYVRKKGNQLVIVHGTRDAESKQVQQETLFVIYSKAEARAAVGQSLHWFRHSLEKENPSIRFDWKKIDAAINEQMDVLPDIYAYKKDRVEGRFREAVVDFTRELLVANPQTLMSSSRLLQDQKYELEYLRDLIDWRLSCADQEENEWNKDDSFHWGTLIARRDVPTEGMERLHTLYYGGEHEKAEALAGLLTESWSNYAEGYSYLGLISMDRGELNAAAAHFDKAMEVGRTLFAKRIPKSDYWSDHSTRPYLRAMAYAAQAHNRMEDYSTALDLCDR